MDSFGTGIFRVRRYNGSKRDLDLTAEELVPISQDDEEEDSRTPEVRQVGTPWTPFVWGILSIMCPIPPVGIIAAGLALQKASKAIEELEIHGKASRDARKNLQTAKVLGYIGLGLGIIVMAVAVFLNIVDPVKKK